jgi:hypothetical protein
MEREGNRGFKLTKIVTNLTDYEGLDDIDIGGKVYRIRDGPAPSAILSLAFGGNMGENSYNAQLAKNACSARRYFGDIPIISQAEIGMNVQDSGSYSVGQESLYKEGEGSLVLSKTTTGEIMKQMIAKAEEIGCDLQNVSYISHPAHAQRIEWVGEKLGIVGDPFLDKEIKWPIEESQPWVRTPHLWVPREILARIQHKLTGQI